MSCPSCGVGRRGSGDCGAPSVGVVERLRDGRRSGGSRRGGSATSDQPCPQLLRPDDLQRQPDGRLLRAELRGDSPGRLTGDPFDASAGAATHVNALAISADGLTAYSADQTLPSGPPPNTTTTVHVEDIATGTNSNFTVPATNVASVNSGGVNPTNGDYYYGGWNSGGSTFSLFAFDPTTDTANLAGTITPPERCDLPIRRPDLRRCGQHDRPRRHERRARPALLSVAGPVPTSGTGALSFTTLATTPASGGSLRRDRLRRRLHSVRGDERAGSSTRSTRTPAPLRAWALRRGSPAT